MLSRLNAFMGCISDEDFSSLNVNQEWTKASTVKSKAMNVTSAKDVTRTSLLVAYYYYYNALHETDDKDSWRNFKELFNDFKSNVDPLLTEAYYPPLSGKSIFDVLITFSSYAYLNI